MSFSWIALPILVFSSSLAFAAGAPPASQGTNQQVATEVPAGEAPPDEADQLITNRQLRAATGSLSRWSMNTYWNYSAGAINAPFDVLRPNITAAGDTSALHSLYADVGVRYRINPKDSLSLSVGLSMASPFHTEIETDNAALREEFEQNAGKLAANDPTMTFRHLDKLGGFQSVSQVSVYLYTSEFRRNAGFRTGALLSQNFMYEVGKTGLSLGSAVQATFNTFGGEVDSGNRPWMVLGLYPAIEYVISDRLNLRTVSGVWVNEFRRNGSEFSRIVYQSVGLGISAGRDVFIYPNLQFLPGDLRADKTNLGLSANVNLF